MIFKESRAVVSMFQCFNIPYALSKNREQQTRIDIFKCRFIEYTKDENLIKCNLS